MAHQWTHGGFCQPPPQPTPPTHLPLPTNNSQPFGWNPWAYATAAPQAPYGEATLEWTDKASWSNPWVVDSGTTSQVALNSTQTANYTNVSPHEVWEDYYYQSASPSEYLAAATWDGSAYIAPSAVYHDQQALQVGDIHFPTHCFFGFILTKQKARVDTTTIIVPRSVSHRDFGVVTVVLDDDFHTPSGNYPGRQRPNRPTQKRPALV
ncbi:hypothetical protein LTR93_005871 [Exophiala xenobiotica]|nr:hypothetical protein LTR93_005871 [Exophiala xenobiotica]